MKKVFLTDVPHFFFLTFYTCGVSIFFLTRRHSPVLRQMGRLSACLKVYFINVLFCVLYVFN